MERIYPMLEETLRLIRYVRQSPEGAALGGQQLRTLFRKAFADMRKVGEQRGLNGRDLDEIGFALAALVDEIVLKKGGALALDWMKEQLQLSLFGENTAGETFFVHLETVRRDSSRAHVLFVYYLVLMLGFRGRYAVHGELALHELTHEVRLELERFGVIVEATLSPSGTAPRESIVRRSEGWVVLGIGAMTSVLAAVFYVGLWADLVFRVRAFLGT
jgi:type VI secretion system protein ImpK